MTKDMGPGAHEWRRRTTLTVEEVADLLGLGRSSAYEAVRTGELPHLRFGRRIVVPTQAIIKLLDNVSPHPIGDR